MADFQLALCYIVPSMYRGLEGMVEWNPVSWEDIGGLQDVKQALKQVGNDYRAVRFACFPNSLQQ